MGWNRNDKSEWGTPPKSSLSDKLWVLAGLGLAAFCLFNSCRGLVD